MFIFIKNAIFVYRIPISIHDNECMPSLSGSSELLDTHVASSTRFDVNDEMRNEMNYK